MYPVIGYFDQTLLLAEGVAKCPKGRIIDCGTGAFVMTQLVGQRRKRNNAHLALLSLMCEVVSEFCVCVMTEDTEVNVLKG